MSEWLTALPALLVVVAIVLVPGLVAAYAVGARGVAGWGLAPGLSMTVLTGTAVVAPFLQLSWSPWLLLAATVVGGVLAWGIGQLLPKASARASAAPRRSTRAPAEPQAAARRVANRDAQARAGHLAADPARTRWFALTGVLVGTGFVLAAVLPGIGSPGELVDSTDVVAHLNRIRRFLDTGVFSSLGSPGHPAYPSAFHDIAGTAAQVVPSLAEGRGLVTAANLTALAAAAVVWPLGVVALVRLTLGRSAVMLLGAGVASAAVTTFPYVLMGWGVLWPNLLGTAMLPGILGPALVSVRVVAPVAGLTRRLAVVTSVAAVPGLALTHPNALVSLALFVLLAVATRLAVQWRRVTGPARRSAVARLLTLVVVCVTGLLVAPRLSRQVADTASYDWGAHDPFWPSLRDVTLLQIQVNRLPWGLLLLMAIGVVVCLRRARLRWVLAGWLAVVLLFLVAATGRPGWGSLVTGYWYNDKVRLGALGAVPAVLLTVVGLHEVSGWVGRALRGFSPVTTLREPRALAVTSSVVAVGLLMSVTFGANHEQASDLVHRYYHPPEPRRVLVTPADEADLATLAGLIPSGVVTADVPANGSSLLYAFWGREVLFDSLLLDPDPDHALIGLHLKEAATRTDVCDALRRGNVQYAVTGPVRYWLSLSDRTAGMAALGGTPGFQEMGAAGRYRLYRIQACGFDPGWLPPS